MAFVDSSEESMTKDFGKTVIRVADSKSIVALVERPFRRSLSVGGERIVLHGPLESFGAPAIGDRYQVDGETLEAINVRETADRNRVSIDCQTLGFEVVFQDVTAIWIDEAEPLFPTAQPFPPNYSLDVLRLRRHPVGARHLLFDVGPLSDAVPEHATVDKVSLEVTAGLPQVGPEWEARVVLRDPLIGESNWSQYRNTRFWEVPGALGPGTDYESSFDVGTGTGFAAGASAIASGPGLLSHLLQNYEGRTAVLVIPTAGTADGEAELDNVAAVPVLRVTYRKAVGV